MSIVSNFGPQEQAMQGYFREGEARAMTLGNRGPIRFVREAGEDRLHPDILAAYNRVGFYVFENVLGAVELSELRAEFHGRTVAEYARFAARQQGPTGVGRRAGFSGGDVGQAAWRSALAARGSPMAAM